MNAVEKSSVDALADLKNTDGMLAISLRADLDALRKKYAAATSDSDAQKSQLISLFVEKDEQRKKVEDLSQELQKAAQGQTVNPEVANKNNEKMEKLRTGYKKLREVSLESIPTTSELSM